jgi:RNA-binding protein
MNKLIHSIQITILEKNEENLEGIHDIFFHLFPIDFKKEQIDIKHEKLEGLEQKIIHSFSLITTKQRHNKILSESILSKINKETKKQLLNQLDSRLDDEGNFYIRFDKQELFHESFQLTDSGNCIHIKIKLAAFPAKKEQFKKSIETLIKKIKKEEN